MSTLYTTMIQTEDGTVYDLGEFEHAPAHPEHLTGCPACRVVNAWTELVREEGEGGE